MVVPEFIGRKQNKITLLGVKYKAIAQPDCEGCAFDSVAGCDTPLSAEGECLCASSDRKDWRSIIWIKD